VAGLSAAVASTLVAGVLISSIFALTAAKIAKEAEQFEIHAREVRFGFLKKVDLANQLGSVGKVVFSCFEF
jgi:hypothetical protein